MERSTAATGDEDGAKPQHFYKRGDFPSIDSFVYCKRMVDLVYYDCLEDEAPERESAEEALQRRTEEGKCVRGASFLMSGLELIVYPRCTRGCLPTTLEGYRCRLRVEASPVTILMRNQLQARTPNK